MVRPFRLCLLALFLTATSVSSVVAQSLQLRGTLDLPGCTAVDAVNGTAYVARVNNFAVVSVLDPNEPALVGQVATGAPTISAIDVEGAYAYCAAESDGLVIINISNPANPELVTSLSVNNSVRGVAVRDTLVVLATPVYVALVGVRRPGEPHVLASFGRAASWVEFDPLRQRVHAGGATGAYSLDIRTTISGSDTNFSFVVDEQFGSTLLSPLVISGPYVDVVQNATLIALDSASYNLAGQRQGPGLIRALAATTGKVFTATANGTVEYLNHTTATPQFEDAATLSAPGTGLALAQTGQQPLLVATHNSGITVLVYDPLPVGPERPVTVPAVLSIGAYPNPFNSAVELQLQAAVPGDYELTIFDILGRAVRHEQLRLDGPDVRRIEFSAQPSGLYYARLSSDHEAAVTRLVYLP